MTVSSMNTFSRCNNRQTSRLTTAALLAAAMTTLATPFAHGAIIPTGGVGPAYPGTNPDPWNVASSLAVGTSGAAGSLTINGGSDVNVSGSLFSGETFDGVVTVTDSGSSLTAGNGFIGDFANGTLTIDTDAIVNFSGTIQLGNSTFNTGTINVTNNSRMDVGSSITVGGSGIGALNINSGGRVTALASTQVTSGIGTGSVVIETGGHLTSRLGLSIGFTNPGTVTVGTAGGAAAGLTVGNYDHTALGAIAEGTEIVVSDSIANVSLDLDQSSSLIYTDGTIRLGVNSNEMGALNVNDPSAVVNANTTIVGDAGTGNSTVGMNATMSGLSLVLGDQAGSTGTLDIDGGFANYTLATIGNAGDATLTLDNSAQMTVNNILGIAELGTSTATVTVDSGSTINANEFRLASWIGDDTTGTLNVTGNSAITTNQYLAVGTSGEGFVNLDTGGDLTVGTDLLVGTTGFIANGYGQVIAGQNSIITADRVIVGAQDDNNAEDGSTVDVRASGASLYAGIDASAANAAIGFSGPRVVLQGGPSSGVLDINAYGNFITQRDIYIGVQSGITNLDIGGTEARLSGTNTFIGFDGTGRLEVFDGGEATFSGTANVGERSFSLGTIIVDGSDSEFFAGLLSLGAGTTSSGNLLVNNGASTSSNGANIAAANNSLGTVIVEDSGSTFSVNGILGLGVGSNATGLVNVRNGGTLSASDLRVAVSTDQIGTLNVSGTESLSGTVNATSALIGQDSLLGFSTAVVNVSAGGTLDVTNNLNIRDSAQFNIIGGKVSAASIDIQSNAFFNWGFGEVEIKGGFTLDPTLAGQLLPNFNNFGPFPPAQLTPNKHLNIRDTLILANPLEVVGGELSFGSLSNASLLDFQSGTVNITGITGWSIDASGPFGANPVITSGQTVTATIGATINAGGSLTLAGGEVDFGSNNLIVGGLVTGQGRVTGNVINNSDGEIRVNRNESLTIVGDIDTSGRVESLGIARIEGGISNQTAGQINVNDGGRMIVQDSVANNGRIDVIDGTLEVGSFSTNAASTGSIVGENATFRYTGGLDNDGSLAFSFGTSRFFGDITNDGSIVATSASNVTFYDDVTNNSTITVSPGTTATFLGSFSGNGIGGGGTVFLEGDTRPGFSPGTMEFDGDLYLGEGHDLIIELGGDDAGDRDQLLVFGDLNLDGDLLIEFIDGYLPAFGETYEFAIAQSVSGNLNLLNSSLPGGREAVLLNSTTIQFIPEPATGLMLLGVSALLRRRRF